MTTLGQPLVEAAQQLAMQTGAPRSMVRDPVTGQMAGLGFELGTALAARLGVPYEVLEFGTCAEVSTAIASGRADFRAFNAGSSRASEVCVAEPLFSQEAGYLSRFRRAGPPPFLSSPAS
jgi:polar amino acid transport system substrate-binding protein